MAPIRALSALVMGCMFFLQAEASLSFDSVPANLKGLSQHRMLHRRVADSSVPVKARSTTKSKRCKARDESSSSSGSNGSGTTEASATITSSSKKAESTSSSSYGKISQANAVTGLINVQSTCGDIGATSESFFQIWTVNPISLNIFYEIDLIHHFRGCHVHNWSKWELMVAELWC